MVYFPIRRILEKNNIKVGYKSTNWIQKRLNNKDPEIEKMSYSGIYKLECQCGAQYISKTTRKFKQRTVIVLYTINQINQITQHIF